MSIWEEEFKHPIDYLLLESSTGDDDFLLFEDDSEIVLEQTGQDDSLWEERTPKN